MLALCFLSAGLLAQKGEISFPDIVPPDFLHRDVLRVDSAHYQKELEKKEAQLLQKVLQEVSGIIERVGKEKNYYMIVEKRNAGVLYAAADADLTDEIIRAYDLDGGKKK